MMRCGHVLGKDVKQTVKSTGGYRDVAVHSGLVYAASEAWPQTVNVYDSSTWRRQLREKTPTPCCSAGAVVSRHTLQVSDDRILLCCWNKNKLHVLSRDSGELLQTHAAADLMRQAATDADVRRGGTTTSAGKHVYVAGVLCGPHLCQVDAEGSALVADEGNHILQVLRPDGTWSVVKLDQIVNRPIGAVWCNPSLYVASDEKLVIFS